MKRYLYKFVIKYNESGLKFPLILNVKVSITACLCLILAYFIIGHGVKIQSVWSQNMFEYDIVGRVRDIMETIDWFAIEKSDIDSNNKTFAML